MWFFADAIPVTPLFVVAVSISTSRRAQVSRENHRGRVEVNETLTKCLRCGGRLDDTRLHDEISGQTVVSQRCINCGDIFDELILTYRAMSAPPKVRGVGNRVLHAEELKRNKKRVGWEL